MGGARDEKASRKRKISPRKSASKVCVHTDPYSRCVDVGECTCNPRIKGSPLQKVALI